MNSVDEIQKRVDLVTNDMLKRHPNCLYTVRILLWNDDTNLVECRHTRNVDDKLIICNSKYYKNELIYEEHLLNYNKISIDGRGNEYNIKQ